MSDSTPGISPKSNINDDVELLLKRLRDFDDATRVDAAIKLSHYPQPKVITALTGRLIDRSAQVRQSAIESLVVLKDMSVCASITLRLKDEVAKVRATAAEALGLLGCKDSAMELVNAVDDEDDKVSKEAGIALGKLAVKNSMEELIHRLDEYIREKRIFALAQFGYETIRPLISTSDCYRDDFADIENYFHNRAKVLTLLQPQPLAEVVKYYNPKAPIKYNKYSPSSYDYNRENRQILSNLYRCGYNPTNLLIIKYIIMLDDDRITPWLCKILTEDPAPVIRWLAMDKLAEMKKPVDDVVRAIVQYLAKDFRSLRIKAINTLVAIEARTSTGTLCSLVASDADDQVVYRTIVALGELSDTRAVPTLVNELINNDKNDEKRKLAAVALSRIPSAEGTDALISALGSDGNPNVRKAAAMSLGVLKAIEARRPLEIVAGGRDENQEVINAAKEALMQIKA